MIVTAIRALVGTLFPLAIVLSGSPTFAEPSEALKSVHTDETSDVVKTIKAETVGSSHKCAAYPCQGRDRPAVDIVKFKAAFNETLILRTVLRASGNRITYIWRIRDDVKNYFVVARAMAGGIELFFYDGLKPETCEGLRGRQSARKSVTVSVPPKCFGSASAVRVGSLVGTQTANYFFFDDALRSAFTPSSPFSRLSSTLVQN